MSSPASAPDPAAAPQSEFLAFMLADEAYAIDILAVREIRAYEPATRIAGAPAFVRGVINLRGLIVPVVDLRQRFGLGRSEPGSGTVIVVLQVDDRLVGMLVDALSDVIALPVAQIRPAPEFGPAIGAQHVRGLATVDEQMLIVLDICALMRAPDMGLFGEQDGSARAETAMTTNRGRS